MESITDNSIPEAINRQDNTTATDEISLVEVEVEVEKRKLRDYINIGKRAIAATTAVVLISPANEAIRVGVAGGAYAATHDLYLTALALGVSTAVIETVSGVSVAGLLNTERGEKAVDWVNKKAAKAGIDKDTKLNPITKGAIAYTTGVGVAVLVEQREDPKRSASKNRKFSVGLSGVLGAITTAQGLLVAGGIADPNPITIAGGVAGVGSAAAIGQWASKKKKKNNSESTEEVQ